MANNEISVDITMDLQEMYDRAILASQAFRAMADNLGSVGRVCVHPQHRRSEMSDEQKTETVCNECGRIITGIE